MSYITVYSYLNLILFFHSFETILLPVSNFNNENEDPDGPEEFSSFKRGFVSTSSTTASSTNIDSHECEDFVDDPENFYIDRDATGPDIIFEDNDFSVDSRNSSPPPSKLMRGTKVLHRHQVSSFSINVVSRDFQNEFPPIIARISENETPEDFGERFMLEIDKLDKKIEKLYTTECNKPIRKLTKAEEKQFQKAESCHICSGNFLYKKSYAEWCAVKDKLTDEPSQSYQKTLVHPDILKGPKVRDHCEFTVLLSLHHL